MGAQLRHLLLPVALSVLAVSWWGHPALLLPPDLDKDLSGRYAVLTGGSRGIGLGFLYGLVDAGATVFVTGRTRDSLEQACQAATGPGQCVPLVVDSSDDSQLDAMFQQVAEKTGGVLDILVNNAFSAVAYQKRSGMLGRPFWEGGMRLFDEVHSVGVRSHFKATQLAVPLMQKRGRGLIVNTNSPGCAAYALSVAYGMGKCSVDKMTADMAMELSTEGIDIVSWWPGVPVTTEDVLDGGVDDGTFSRRGKPAGLPFPPFQALARTALATTPLFEGRALAGLARDRRGAELMSGLAVWSTHLGRRYGVLDERGLRPPALLSLKYQAVLWLPGGLELAVPAATAGDDGTPVASSLQAFFFNQMPDGDLPIWLLKLVGGPPLTMQWPLP